MSSEKATPDQPSENMLESWDGSAKWGEAREKNEVKPPALEEPVPLSPTLPVKDNGGTTVSAPVSAAVSTITSPNESQLHCSFDLETTAAVKKKKKLHGRDTASLLSATSSRIFNFRKAASVHRIGPYRKKSGVTTYKETPTNTLMKSIQVGLHHSIGGLASKPCLDLLMAHFSTIDSDEFPSEGSHQTPAHEYGTFTFKTYAPLAFRHFRAQFGIDVSDFLVSICNEALRELGNPGASGSVFYLTHDDEFIIKTVQRKESQFLQHLLPGYYMNLIQNKQTLLPKFFGLYSYENFLHRHSIRMVVMNNLLPSCIFYHEKYDLKGSTYKRFASEKELMKKSPTRKDLDFLRAHPEGFTLEPEVYRSLMESIHRDTTLLESFAIMDYSMLLGVHNVDEELRCARAKDTKLEQKTSAEPIVENKVLHVEPDADVSSDSLNPNVMVRSASEGNYRSPNDSVSSTGSEPLFQEGTLAASESMIFSSTTSISLSARRRTFGIINETKEIVEMFKDVNYEVPPGGIPARNSKGDRLFLFIGIIDILQSYRLRKKMEHGLKAVMVDGDTVSVHKPSFYAQRFRTFMSERIFKCAEVRRKSNGSCCA